MGGIQLFFFVFYLFIYIFFLCGKRKGKMRVVKHIDDYLNDRSDMRIRAVSLDRVFQVTGSVGNAFGCFVLV